MNEADGYIRPDWAKVGVSTKRVVVLDLARFVAMLLMIQGHTIDALASREWLNIDVFPWSIWHFLRGFTAPVFLTISGAAHVFANKRDENGKLLSRITVKRVRMALTLIFIGYLLMFPAANVWDLPFIESRYWPIFLRANILQLIGISLLMVLALYLLTRTDKALKSSALVVALVITVLSPFVHSINWFDYLPQAIAAYLSFESGSLFPVFPYAAFMFYGLYIGVLLKDIERAERVDFILKRFISFGAIIVLAGYGIKAIIAYLGYESSFRANPGVIIYQVGFVLVGLSCCAAFFKLTKKLSYFYILFGKRALFIYILHLVILYGSHFFGSLATIYKKTLPFASTLIIALSLIIFCLLLVYLYEMSINKFPRLKKYYFYALYAIAAYILLI